jgi:hypothetical protein
MLPNLVGAKILDKNSNRNKYQIHPGNKDLYRVSRKKRSFTGSQEKKNKELYRVSRKKTKSFTGSQEKTKNNTWHGKHPKHI